MNANGDENATELRYDRIDSLIRAISPFRHARSIDRVRRVMDAAADFIDKGQWFCASSLLNQAGKMLKWQVSHATL